MLSTGLSIRDTAKYKVEENPSPHEKHPSGGSRK